MTVTEQKQFIADLIETVRAEILRNAFDMPSAWDGIELRQYIADRFARETMPMRGARLRNYRNAITISASL